MKIDEIDKSLPIEIYNKDRFDDRWVQINLVEYDQEDVVYYYQGKLIMDELTKVDFRNKAITYTVEQVMNLLWEGWLHNYSVSECYDNLQDWLLLNGLLSDVIFEKDNFGKFIKVEEEK